MDFISRALLGVRYQANTLIGGPQRPEQFVVRADAFDCVTYCEIVLAAAMARNYGEFETALRKIRYEHGKVGGPSAITISPNGAAAPSRKRFAPRWRCPKPSPSTRP